MKKYIILLLALAVSSGVWAQRLKIYQVDALEKILRESPLQDNVDTVRVARGETATVQMAIRANGAFTKMRVEVGDVTSGTNTLTGATVGWVNYVHVGKNYTPASNMVIKSATNYFPDPILTDTTVNITKDNAQPLWISVPVKVTDAPGLYKGTVKITGNRNNRPDTWTKDFYIRVYPVTVGKSPLLVCNWSSHTALFVLELMNGDRWVDPFGSTYWQLIDVLAKSMASHGQNVYRIFPVWSTIYTYNAGKYTFDFSRFDKEVEIYKSTGSFERIIGGQLAWSKGNDMFIEVPLPDNAETRPMLHINRAFDQSERGYRMVDLPFSDKRAKNFLNQYLPALRAHLIEKGWWDIYMQNIYDEPNEAKLPDYIAINKYVRKKMKGVKITDAFYIDGIVNGYLDIYCPMLSTFASNMNSYKSLQRSGKELWYYTCTLPRENYANRFIELPLLQTRLLHWINYAYGITGYLHWGLNSWTGNDLNVDANRQAGDLPGGDKCIIYPGYHKVYSTIRYDAERDGITDYTLLKMLEAKNASLAKRLTGEMILAPDRYNNSIQHFRDVRRQLLEALSE
jgi:hypothetical protein